MRFQFTDYYGQHVEIHNETGSGNIRLRVKTCQSLNDVPKTPKEECPVVTDISLNEKHLNLLVSILQAMQEQTP